MRDKGEEILYRVCARRDGNGILEVCHRTGFMGEDLAGTGRFRDKKLLGYLFCLYYVYYEPENGFVAVDANSGGIIGYILGTTSTRRYDTRYAWTMNVRIVLRLLFFTWWRYPESARQTLFWIIQREKYKNDISEDLFPAHLHINVLPGFQRMGVGKALMGLFTDRLRERGVPGVHLVTSSGNRKAVSFYQKTGFTTLAENRTEFWRGIRDERSLVFGKKL